MLGHICIFGALLSVPFLFLCIHVADLFFETKLRGAIFLTIPAGGTWFLVSGSEKDLFSRIVAGILLWVAYGFGGDALLAIREREKWFGAKEAPGMCLTIWLGIAFLLGTARYAASVKGLDAGVVIGGFGAGLAEIVYFFLASLMSAVMLRALRLHYA